MPAVEKNYSNFLNGTRTTGEGADDSEPRISTSAPEEAGAPSLKEVIGVIVDAAKESRKIVRDRRLSGAEPRPS